MGFKKTAQIRVSGVKTYGKKDVARMVPGTQLSLPGKSTTDQRSMKMKCQKLLGSSLGGIVLTLACVSCGGLDDEQLNDPSAALEQEQNRTAPRRKPVEKIGHLVVRAHRSIKATGSDEDRDRDGLEDHIEGALANAFRPYLKFDSAEGARRGFEPITVFQVRPYRSYNVLRIKWVFLFERDGGYGPSSSCKDAHHGDNASIWYNLTSNDGGKTWALATVDIGAERWPYLRMETIGLTHPVIYMSSHKHHHYFSTANDHKDSKYSRWGCNDDVNGRGAHFFVNLRSLEKRSGYFNNVGEPEHHPRDFFVNKLYPYFQREYYPHYHSFTIWEGENFYEVGPNKDKFFTFPLPDGNDVRPCNKCGSRQTCCGRENSRGCCSDMCVSKGQLCP